MSLLIGASMNADDLGAYPQMLAGNNIMRIFVSEVTVGGKKIKVLPSWTDARFVYCQANGVIPFVTSKCDGDPVALAYVKDQLANMPSWITTLYVTDHHEPEDLTASTFKNNFRLFWQMLATLPADTRAKIRCGPVLAKTWVEGGVNKGNNDWSKYDPASIGFGGDFFGGDMYVPSGTKTTVVDPGTIPSAATFLTHFKAYKYDVSDTRPRIFPEVGLIGMPADTDGTARAAFITDVYDEVSTWHSGAPGWTQPWDFAGMIWWNSKGKATGQVKDIGQARDFPLHLRSQPDAAKTTVDGNGNTLWVSNPVLLPGSPPAPLDAWNTIFTTENPPPSIPPFDITVGTVGGVNAAQKVNPSGGTGVEASGWLLGATLRKADIGAWEPRLASNKLMRIFPNSNGLPPAWSDTRFAYAQRVGAVPFVSSNIDGDSTKFAGLRQWLIDMPAWVEFVYITDRHEPENNFPDPAIYKANFTAWFEQVIEALPADTRARVRAGHVLSRQWAEHDISRSWSTYDTGLGDFFAGDMYFDSWGSPSTTVATSYGSASDFVAGFAAYTFDGSDTRDRVWAEWGAIGIPADPTGEQRAQWMRDVAAILDTWGPATTGWVFIGAAWWNNQGTTSSTSLTGSPGIGTLRYFYLDSFQNGVDQPPTAYPSTPAPPLAEYNRLALTHQSVDPAGPPEPGGGDPDPDPTPEPDPTPDPEPTPAEPGDASQLPADLPPSARLMAAEYLLLITDKNLMVVGDPIDTWTTLDITLRWNEPSSGQFTAPGYAWVREQIAPGNRVVCIRRVLGNAKVVLAGPIESTLYERSDDGENGGDGQLTVTWSDDLSWIAGRLTYPEPAHTPETQTSDFWLWSGNTEDGMLALVEQNAGPSAQAIRRVPRLVTAAPKGLPGTVVVSATVGQARFVPCTDTLRDMAKRGGGYGFRTYQTMAARQIVFEVYAPRDLTRVVRFGFGLGNLKYLSYETTMPEKTAVIVGGQYNADDVSAGADKFVMEVRTHVTEGQWGRIESYLPRPGNDPIADLTDEAVKELNADDEVTTLYATGFEPDVPKPVGTAGARLTSTAADTVDQRYGAHYDLGDIVSIEFWDGVALSGPIKVVHIQAWPTAGEVVNTLIGNQDSTHDYEQVKQLRAMDRRVGRLERNVAVRKSP